MKLYPAERINMGISAGAIAASFAFATPHFAGSLALGAALQALNFRFLHGTAEALFGGVVGGSGPWVAVLGLRFGILGLGIAAAMLAGADPLGMVIGLSIAMPASVATALWNRPEVVEQAPNAALPPDDSSWDQYSVWRAAEREEEEDEKA
jgi:hypothetical protein